MALIVRIDVDRAFGRKPLWRHVLSRVASDAYFPRIESLGYLRELGCVLRILNQRRVAAHVFFRACTLPSPGILALLRSGGHRAGLHLEDSRSFETFSAERARLERHTGEPVSTFSKHGSGSARHGRHHHAPYEPDKYIAWGQRANMTLFLGNLEDPTMPPFHAGGLTVFPAAFWLEPAWRDTARFTVEWLAEEARHRDVVLLLHPENVLASSALTEEFLDLLTDVPTALPVALHACN